MVYGAEGVAQGNETTAPTEPQFIEMPYLGMDVSMIDSTGMGPHTKVGYNYKNDSKGKHRCTLYYWIEDGRCKLIVRVQDDTGEVILVEENPAGSYFGNPIDAFILTKLWDMVY